MSASLITRTLRESQLQPHRCRYYLTSTDPNYDDKVRNIVGLYLRPPAGATVLCLDEKPNIQALSRRHPELPMRVGYPEAREFEYVRHGVVHLFAAFNARTGHVVADVFEHKNRWTFLEFLDQLAWRYRSGPVHCVLDNASYHFTAEVQEWLRRHPRFSFHFTPTHASWINQVEVWFSLVGRKVVARGSFASKAALREALLAYAAYWNLDAHPFDWTWGAELLDDSRPVAAATVA